MISAVINKVEENLAVSIIIITFAAVKLE